MNHGGRDMLEALNGWVSVNTLLWLFPVFFMLHDFEEIIFIESWWKKYGHAVLPKLPSALQPRVMKMAGMTSGQFAVAVMLEFIVFIPITYAASERGVYLLFLGCNAVLFLHVFTHVGQSLYLRRYTPGVVTAVVFALPYPAYLFYRLTQEGIVTWPDIGLSIPFGILLLPLVLAGHELGRRIVPAEG